MTDTKRPMAQAQGRDYNIAQVPKTETRYFGAAQVTTCHWSKWYNGHRTDFFETSRILADGRIFRAYSFHTPALVGLYNNANKPRPAYERNIPEISRERARISQVLA